MFGLRPIDSQTPACSPAALAGLTIYLAAPDRSVLLRQAALRRAVLESDPQHQKLKTPPENRRGFYSGDVLLSHGLSPYYHRGCSVSLPCSEWERVVPLRYCHQSAEPHWRLAAVAATQARSRVSGDFGGFRLIAVPKFRKNTIFNRHSQVANRKSFLIRWHLHTGFRKQIR